MCFSIELFHADLRIFLQAVVFEGGIWEGCLQHMNAVCNVGMLLYTKKEYY
jgi:hypothetical protein